MSVKVRWLGHNCFTLTTPKGSVILTDPYAKTFPLKLPQTEADVVLVSHEHHDHNAVWRIEGNPLVVKRTSEYIVEHEIHIQRTEEVFRFKGIPTFHDAQQGTQRGPNTVFVWTLEGMRFCHLGDLGHTLKDDQIAAMAPVDLLFLPTGGHVTINSQEAAMVVNQLDPKVVFPMHYKLPPVTWPLEEVDLFLNRMDRVERLDTVQVEIKELPARRHVLVLRYDQG
ncbi:MAG: MBL fold metallo-hydrolase [Armatimonadetes bacterium]|nr:MBL fold metallo-hydrolase [Armatimonadota bacterium]